MHLPRRTPTMQTVMAGGVLVGVMEAAGIEPLPSPYLVSDGVRSTKPC